MFTVPLLVIVPFVISEPPELTVSVAPLFIVRLLHEAVPAVPITGAVPLDTSGIVMLSADKGKAVGLQFDVVAQSESVVPVHEMALNKCSYAPIVGLYYRRVSPR